MIFISQIKHSLNTNNHSAQPSWCEIARYGVIHPSCVKVTPRYR